MNLLLVSALLLTSNAFASQNYFFYSKGPLKGKPVISTSDFGSDPICFKGNPFNARKSLLEMAMDDFEKDKSTAWYDQRTKKILFSYVSTKCMDDSLDATEEDCRNEVSITKCSF